MTILDRLNEQDVQTLAASILGEALGADGLDHVEIRSGDDHDGDPALFITAVLKSNVDVLPADTFTRAYEALDEGLQAKGERRFPYFEIQWIDDDGGDESRADGAT